MTDFLQQLSAWLEASPALAHLAAFLSGAITGANPCVLVTIPLVIAYVGSAVGVTKRRAFAYSLAFVLGIAMTFTALGIIAALAGRLFGDVGWFWKYLIAGVAIVMGLQLLGLFEIPTPNFAATRPSRRGMIGAFLLGLLFGVISSPCATPVLAVILAIVAAQGKILYGSSLLFVYALGHSVLMLLVGTFAGVAKYLIESKGAATFSVWTKRLSGAIFVLVGVYIIF
jgi:cytochrome c biogenesis protein CcdA